MVVVPSADNLHLRSHPKGDMSEWVPLQLSDTPPNPHVWSAKVKPGDGDPHQSITVHICSPVLSSVGLYRLLLHMETLQSRRSYALGSFVLLFNPWLKGGLQTPPLLSAMAILHWRGTAFQMIQCTCLWMFRETSTSRATIAWCIWAAIRISVGDPGYMVKYVGGTAYRWASFITEANEVHLHVCVHVCVSSMNLGSWKHVCSSCRSAHSTSATRVKTIFYGPIRFTSAGSSALWWGKKSADTALMSNNLCIQG